MNSEVGNNLALSSVTPVKTELGTQSSSSNHKITQQPVNVQAEEQNKHPPTLDSIKNATSQSNPLLQAVNLSVEYSVDNSTKEIVMKVVDAQTGKTVRQIPSSEMLDFVKRLQDWETKQKGAVIQTSA